MTEEPKACRRYVLTIIVPEDGLAALEIVFREEYGAPPGPDFRPSTEMKVLTSLTIDDEVTDNHILHFIKACLAGWRDATIAEPLRQFAAQRGILLPGKGVPAPSRRTA